MLLLKARPLFSTLSKVLMRRRAWLPRINKQWARVLRGPSSAWRVVSGELLLEGEVETTLKADVVLAWFTRRSG